MENLQSKRIYFDAEDRPPPSYWHGETQIHPSDDDNFKISHENENFFPLSSSKEIKTKIDPKEWLKAPEFVPRSKQILDQSFHPDEMIFANNLPINNSINGIILRNHILRQQPQAHVLAATAARMPFSPVRTILDLPQPIISAQNMVPFAIDQSTPPYCMPTVTATPPQQPQPLPTSLPSGAAMIRFPIPSFNQTALALPEIGLPIPAVILKKKRRKRHRRLKANLSSATERVNGDSFCNGLEAFGDESTQTQLQAISSEPNLNKNSLSEQPSTEDASNSETHPLGGSCPDLSNSQLLLWDNYLFDTIMNETNDIINEENANALTVDPMQQSEYEIASRPVLAAMDSALHADGIYSKSVRQLDRFLQGDGSNIDDSLSEDGLVERLRDRFENQFLDSPASTTRSLKAEFEELSFRPTISKYGYPQADFSSLQIATFNPQYNTTTSTILKSKEIDRHIEDYFEGGHIRLNAFIGSDDLALSDSELPQLSRFQQLQWTIQQNTKYYTNLATPKNMCCSIM
uniref:Bm10483 n=1 Tax=Brugia malayi TaxID=6279 RepID=A0A0J9XYD3_BRUMA|nr:Bm10483 [Brugia malayi]